MPKFAANLSLLWTEHAFVHRFAAAAKAGFRAVEFQFPYDWALEDLTQAARASGLQVVLHNLPAGNWQAGERGIACLPERVEEFQSGVEQAIRYAEALGVKQLNCLAGIRPATLAESVARATLISNLRYATSQLQQHGMRLLIEPLNHFDVPGFMLCHSRQAMDLIEAVGEGLWLQYDIYHMQRMEGELANTLKALLPHIGHVQIADTPGRFEPGTGEIHYPFLLRWLDQLGYAGWVGCEYKPQHGTDAGLAWIKALGFSL